MATTGTGTDTDTAPVQKLTLMTMAGMVVGSMVGAGVFSLPRRFAPGDRGGRGADRLAGRRGRDADAGLRVPDPGRPQAEPGRRGLRLRQGRVRGVPGILLRLRLLGQRLRRQRDLLGADHVHGRGHRSRARPRRHPAGDRTLYLGVWVYFYFIQRGMQGAAVINRIVTVAKVVPILVFIFLALFALDPGVFADNLRGGTGYGSLFDQVKGTMLVTVFVFLGVEGASVYSRHAKRREDVGRATILGFLSVFAIFASVTIVTYGVLPASEIAELRQPSMAGVLESVVGEWGKAFVSVGLIVSVLGAYLAWTLMAAEVLFVAAKDDDMPRFLARTRGADVPFPALLLSTILVQVMLVVTLFSEDAFNFALDRTSALTLIPFLPAAAYALKLALTRETYT